MIWDACNGINLLRQILIIPKRCELVKTDLLFAIRTVQFLDSIFHQFSFLEREKTPAFALDEEHFNHLLSAIIVPRDQEGGNDERR